MTASTSPEQPYRVPPTLEWVGDAATGHLRLIDQTQLPGSLEYLACRTVTDVWEAIRALRVRVGAAPLRGCGDQADQQC